MKKLPALFENPRNFEKIKCPICQSSACNIIETPGQFEIKINIAICQNCALVYLNPRWKKSLYNEFYSKHYDQFFQRSIESTNESPSYQVIWEKIKKYVDTSKKGNILDIGAGSGNGLLELKKQHAKAELYAIESSHDFKKKYKSMGIHFIGPDADAKWETQYKNKFDIIVLRHVFEHMLEPITVLKKIRTVLKKTGILYIAVPNMDNPEFPLTKSFLRVVHTIYFRKTDLLKSLISSGFELIKINNKDPQNIFELHAICKKTNKNSKKEIKYKNNEWIKTEKFLNEQIQKENKLSFKLYWGLRTIIVKYFLNLKIIQKLKIKKIALKINFILRSKRHSNKKSK